MNDVYHILNKKYDRSLVHHKQIKKSWKALKERLMDQGIDIKQEDDASYFQYEIIEYSLQTKSKLEDVFFDTYVTMYDYWYDLTYQERKKQMNIDIDACKENLPHFMEGVQAIYMPCFDARFNHLYTDEIVLLDLKQYHVFIRSFAKEIKLGMYGVKPFLQGFSSAEALVYRGQDFVLYHPLTNRLYLYKDNVFVKACSFDPRNVCENEDTMMSLAQAMLEEDEDTLMDIVLESTLVAKGIHKKIVAYKKKKAKQQEKAIRKEAKKKK